MKEINSSYCTGEKCTKRHTCDKYIGNHILEFYPKSWVKAHICILDNHKEFKEIK